MSRTFAVLVVVAGLVGLDLANPAGASRLQAQGLLISSDAEQRHSLPRPVPRVVPGEPAFLYDVARLEIDASIRDQVAQVQVSQTFKNRSSQTLQVKFIFPLPYDGAIDQMTFMVDGQELEGQLLEADKAREIYQSYVRRSKDPALVQWIGTGMFQTQVFPVPPDAERTVSLRYTQLCRRSGSLTDWLLPLAPARFTAHPIGEVAIRGRIRSETRLGNVYSPSHDVEIDREGDGVARFQYTAKGSVPDRDFRILWDSGDDAIQMSVIAHRADDDEDGYFMLLVQPQFPAVPEDYHKTGKQVVLVLDKSGSMRGEKIDQARSAARYVVDRLKSRDRFTLIHYDSEVDLFRSELVEADKDTRTDAKDYIDSMLAGGSTNIDEALSKAFQLAGDGDGPVYVVFMTDGQPTVGEQNAMKIAANAQQRVREGTRLFSLGVGHDVNSRLLDKLASICLGQTTYVRPGEPLDQVIAALYDRIGAPALTDADLRITVDGQEGRTRQLYPSKMYDLFSGDQLVIVGRYRRHGSLQVTLSGDYLGDRQEYRFAGELPKVTDSRDVFVERLWATRRIGQIIDEIDLHGENRELVDELIALSKRHGILTPYTAYLAEERTGLNDAVASRELARESLMELQQEAGESAFRQRFFKGELKSSSRAATPSAAADSFGLEVQMRGGLAAPAGAAGQVQAPAIVGKPVERVKQIAAKTFFLRGQRYIDADASDAQIDGATRIEQFSDEYFKLLGELDDESRAYLAEELEVLVILRDKAYLITPPTK
jgi:Ca-activated chloride channel family protein